MSIIHRKSKCNYYSKIDQTFPNKSKLTPQSRRKFMKLIFKKETLKSPFIMGVLKQGEEGEK